MSVHRSLLVCLLLLAGCHRGKVADVTLDADRAAENATAAKTIADLAAAEEASQGPAPIIRRETSQPAPATKPSAPDDAIEPADDESLPQGNATDTQGD